MPVTIHPQPAKVGVNADPIVTSSADLLQAASKAWCCPDGDARWTNTNKKIGPEDRRILRTSFMDLDNNQPAATSASNPFAAFAPAQRGLVPYGNGFVDGIMRAFQQDLHLVLRPDDVWLATLVQFSFYVNGHADELRSTFVSHEGKETLCVDVTPATLEEVDVGAFARAMTGLMQAFIVEEGVREWLLPSFTTTTDEDLSVASIVMMATMKAYFEYVMMCGCGFPSVRLEGERRDWENLLERTKRFAKYGDEPAEWSLYLAKVVENMVASFDRPDDQDIKDFWMRVCHAAGGEGSMPGGLESLSGWITAFCFWDDEGKKVHAYTDRQLAGTFGARDIDRKRLILDGVSFPIIRRKTVPKSVADVPVKVIDLASQKKYDTTLVAGSVGMMATAAGGRPGLSTFQPRAGWWMLLDAEESLA